MVVPTRHERQQRTRLDLVAAAEREILSAGLARASIRGICAAAGYTLGAFYSNFTSKDELVLAVADAKFFALYRSLADIVAASGEAGKRATVEAVSEWLARVEKDTGLAAFSIECALHARHNPAFREQVAEHRRHVRELFADALRELLQRMGRVARIPVETLVEGLMALWQGAALSGSYAGTPCGEDRPLVPLFLEAMTAEVQPGAASPGESPAPNPATDGGASGSVLP